MRNNKREWGNGLPKTYGFLLITSPKKTGAGREREEGTLEIEKSLFFFASGGEGKRWR